MATGDLESTRNSKVMYSIVSSSNTKQKWSNTIDLLVGKYQTKWPKGVSVIEYSKNVLEALSSLRQARPSYTCFIALYDECTADYVRTVNCLTREIDPSNPYGDTIWAILTGFEEDDVRFTIEQEPLTVRRILGGTMLNLNLFESGSWYCDFNTGVSYHKKIGSNEIIKKKSEDVTKTLVEEIFPPRLSGGDQGVDMIVNSGHASNRDFSIGLANGKFVSLSEGRLQAVTKFGESFTIPSPRGSNPKIFCATGNCLVGLISDSSSMALALQHTARVVQLMGYIVSTWFGYGGWGMHRYFFGSPGIYSFSESFFANQQALLATLYTKYISKGETSKGLIFDMDNVVLYGDPAWEAKLEKKPAEDPLSNESKCSAPYLVDDKTLRFPVEPFEFSVQELPPNTVLGEDWRIWSLKVNGHCGRPPVYIFRHTVSKYKVLEGNAIINCRFVMPLNSKVVTTRSADQCDIPEDYDFTGEHFIIFATID